MKVTCWSENAGFARGNQGSELYSAPARAKLRCYAYGTAVMRKFENRTIDEAREWRDKLQAEWDAKPQSHAVAGLIVDPNCYHVYVSTFKGERPGQQLRKFFKYLKELVKANGPLPASFMTSSWLIELPSGETLCGFSSARRAALVSQSDLAMVPLAQAGAVLIRAFAASSGRSAAEIDSGFLIFQDGRRMPLEACRCRRITNEEWRSPTRTRRPKRPSA